MTFDVEEWFQVENLRTVFPSQTWGDQTSTVLKNTNRILNIFDKYKIKATFFILGWVAKNCPELVERINQHGHEIASHGTGHNLTYSLSDQELTEDIQSAKHILEDIIGSKINGYRAPNFSVNDRLIDTLRSFDFKYDSSYNPFQLNSRYGKIDLPQSNNNGIYEIKDNFFEIPLSTLKVFDKDVPMAGGAYFRIFPFQVFKQLVKKKLQRDKLYHFYLHPWEFEPEQPRIKNIKLNYRLRHYTGLKKTETKFENLIRFLLKQNCQFFTITDYLRIQKLI